jgi:hypothetical protein
MNDDGNIEARGRPTWGEAIMQMLRSGEKRMDVLSQDLKDLRQEQDERHTEILDTLEEYRPPCNGLVELQERIGDLETTKKQGIAVWKVLAGIVAGAFACLGLAVTIVQLLKGARP